MLIKSYDFLVFKLFRRLVFETFFPNYVALNSCTFSFSMHNKFGYRGDGAVGKSAQRWPCKRRLGVRIPSATEPLSPLPNAWQYLLVMVTFPYKLKILDQDKKPQTNKINVVCFTLLYHFVLGLTNVVAGLGSRKC